MSAVEPRSLLDDAGSADPPSTLPLPFEPAPAPEATPALEAARDADADPAAVMAGVRELVGDGRGALAPWPAFAERLLAIGRADPALARLAEGHLDALRILAELGERPAPAAMYGVWASKSGGSGWRAERADAAEPSAFRVTGLLRFASGAGMLDRALATVPGEGGEQLLDLDVANLDGDPAGWRTAAMRRTRSLDLELDGAVLPGRPIGAPGDYLGRWGFAPGGVGVAAAWAGGIALLADLLGEAPGEGEAGRMRLGRIRLEAGAATELVRAAARALDGPCAGRREAAAEVAARCRAAVAAAARRAIGEARLLAGPARLAFDGRLAAAVADLELYVAQHPDDRAHAALGAPDAAGDAEDAR